MHGQIMEGHGITQAYGTRLTLPPVSEKTCGTYAHALEAGSTPVCSERNEEFILRSAWVGQNKPRSLSQKQNKYMYRYMTV